MISAHQVLTPTCPVDETPSDQTADGVIAASEVKEYHHLITRSLRESALERATCLFLGVDSFQTVQKSYEKLKAGLRMECLSRFLNSQKGQIVFTNRFEKNTLVEPIWKTITIENQSSKFLWEGTAFILLPDEKIVLSSEYDPVSDTLDVSIRTNKKADKFLQDWKNYTIQNNFLRGKAIFADGAVIERNKEYGWDDIILPENLKTMIRLNVEGFLSNGKTLRRMGAKGRRGIILAGPPGVGKTLVGKVLAQTLKNVSFLWVSPRHAEDPSSFESIMSLARFIAPTVLFLEDIDLYGETRHHGGWLGLGELMNQLDGAVDNQDILTIATTNRLNVVEDALRNRPGRFDRVIEFGTMDKPSRQKLLTKLLDKVTITSDDLNYLTEKTDGFTGAELEEVVNTVLLIALDNHNDHRHDFSVDKMPIHRNTIDIALEETCFMSQNKRFGFHVA